MTDKSMPEHHRAWLQRNTHRDADWLQKMLDDGFEVHHLNEDDANNDPTNVVLLDMGDHAMMHGVTMAISVFRERKAAAGERRAKRAAFAEENLPLAYHLRRVGLTWRGIAEKTGFDESLIAMATCNYAHSARLKWPPPPLDQLKECSK